MVLNAKQTFTLFIFNLEDFKPEFFIHVFFKCRLVLKGAWQHSATGSELNQSRAPDGSLAWSGEIHQIPGCTHARVWKKKKENSMKIYLKKIPLILCIFLHIQLHIHGLSISLTHAHAHFCQGFRSECAVAVCGQFKDAQLTHRHEATFWASKCRRSGTTTGCYVLGGGRFGSGWWGMLALDQWAARLDWAKRSHGATSHILTLTYGPRRKSSSNNKTRGRPLGAELCWGFTKLWRGFQRWNEED